MANKTRKHLKKPNGALYGVYRILSKVISKTVFNYKLTENEMDGTSGRRVIIANHESAVDFLMLAATLKERAHFVISSSFYRSLPIRRLMDGISVIPKNQFQTVFTDMRLMKEAVDAQRPLVIYPAGLMPDDGLGTYIPTSTGKTLKWLDADVYVAKVSGTYLANPKWSKIRRKGRVDFSITKLISKEDAAALSADEMQKRVERALYFDAYKTNDEKRIPFKNGDDVEGLENVLYACPECGREFCIEVKDKKTLYCSECGLSLTADEYGLFTPSNGKEEYRYPSTISNIIERKLADEIATDPSFEMRSAVEIHLVNDKKRKFQKQGEGEISINAKTLELHGELKGEKFDLVLPSSSFPMLPFKPGKSFEIQDSGEIYRIIPSDKRAVKKWIHVIKSYHKLSKSQ